MERLKNVNVYNIDMEDYAYITFILGRDFLHDKLKYDNGEEFEDDIAFEECIKITDEFLSSDEYKQHKGLYDCLIDFLQRKQLI